MKEIIKQLILEFHQEQVPTPFTREIELAVLPKNVRKASILMGMRRSGKTYLLYQHIHNQLKQNIPIEKTLYLNFEDDRLISFKTENFQDLLDVYFELYPNYAHDPQVNFYFDEIYLVEAWEKFIRRLLDKEQMGIFVTGSSAKMLSKEMATSLRGRAISTEVFPCSFHEYLAFNNIVMPLPLTAKNQSLLRHHATQYLSVGGFPETLYIAPGRHRELIQEYVNSVIFRDVIERYAVSNAHVVKLFLLHCLQNLSAPLSINKLYNSLKSNGVSIGKNSLYEYLEYFEEAYLLFAIPIYDLSLRKRQANPKKIYAIDPGVLSAYSINSNFDQGPAFENAVFLQLRRQFNEIFYYKTKSNKEIDFVVLTKTGSLQLYQCCVELSSEKTKNREISAFIEAASELGSNELFLITQDTEDTLHYEELTIQVIPFWKWAGHLTPTLS